jgi:rare lipoprotein A (peptidoglycan hydrolase)
VSEGALQRQLALAGVALLAVLFALAMGALARGSEGEQDVVPRSVPAPDGGWYSALAAPYRLDPEAGVTACGHEISNETMGVAHPTLPCGAKLYLSFEGVQVLTQVVDRGSGAPGREFDLTAPLARRMGLQGVQRIEWRFAAS